MRNLTWVGVIVVVLGIAGLVVNVIPVHHTEQVAKIGPITATTDKETDYVIPTWASIVVIIVGAALAYAGTRQR